MPDVPQKLPPKKEVALALLESSSVFIHLDPRREGVVVPRWFVGQPQLVLQVGLNLVVPIPDLTVDDDGISCTLSFSRTPFWCKMPWTAIYALVDETQRGMVWPADIPPEVAAQAAAQAQQKGAEPPAEKPGKKPRAKLTAVKDPPKEGQRSSGRASRSKKTAAARSPKSEGADATAAPPPEKAPRPARPRLAVAPSKAPPPEPAAAAGSSAPPQETAKPDPSAAKPGAGRAGDKKAKRELPPYLRVIK